MHIVTSIGQKRTERQQKCISSWLAIGCSVTAVQSTGETDLLQPMYPDVKFKETKLVGNVFSRPRLVRISALIKQAVDENILILNSDIEVTSSREVFNQRWSSCGPHELKCGLRLDVNTQGEPAGFYDWGIDAFLITPQIRTHLRDIGMTMGCPAWDYWIPIQLRIKKYNVIVHRHPELLHEIHDRNWSDSDLATGSRLIQRYFRMNQKEAFKYIIAMTRG